MGEHTVVRGQEDQMEVKHIKPIVQAALKKMKDVVCANKQMLRAEWSAPSLRTMERALFANLHQETRKRLRGTGHYFTETAVRGLQRPGCVLRPLALKLLVGSLHILKRRIRCVPHIHSP